MGGEWGGREGGREGRDGGIRREVDGKGCKWMEKLWTLSLSLSVVGCLPTEQRTSPSAWSPRSCMRDKSLRRVSNLM